MNLLQIHEPGQTPLPHAGAIAIGIDLGTTHSAVAVALAGDAGRAAIIRDPQGQALLPSVVYYGDDGSIEVGQSARLRHERGEKNALVSIKRLMGRGSEDIKPLLGAMPYAVVADAENKGMVRLHVAGRTLTPVEISAEILRTLKKNAETALDSEINQAVITVPAYFDDAARAATKDAARLAGLEVLRLVNEPTAAALAYGLDKGVEGIYAVYDLGGGTFDMSLLKLERGVFQVLSTAGDTQLGGDDFDQAIAAWIVAEAGQGTILSPEEIGVIVAQARTAKHALTEQDAVAISYKGSQLTLTADAFETLIAPYIDKTLAVCEQAMQQAKLPASAIHGVIMVGGSTRVKLVQRRVQELFGKTPLTDVNPDEVVALGAALQAQALTGAQEGGHLLIDVIPLSIGLETMGGLTEKILQRNSPIPLSVAQEFTTYQDGQNGMQLHIVQGEREMVQHNRSLARFELTGIPPLPAGIARVSVQFTVDADGLLTVSAEEKTTGARQEIHVKPSYGLSSEQIERMLLDSMQHARDDITERLLVEARVDAARAIAELESAIKQDDDLLEDSERKRIARQITVVNNAIEGSDRHYIDAELQELGRITQLFAERRMDRAISSALKGANINEVVSGQ